MLKDNNTEENFQCAFSLWSWPRLSFILGKCLWPFLIIFIPVFIIRFRRLSSCGKSCSSIFWRNFSFIRLTSLGWRGPPLPWWRLWNSLWCIRCAWRLASSSCHLRWGPCLLWPRFSFPAMWASTSASFLTFAFGLASSWNKNKIRITLLIRKAEDTLSRVLFAHLGTSVS